MSVQSGQSENVDSYIGHQGFALTGIPAVAAQNKMATFVVRGDLQKIETDAYLLPSDSFGHVTDSWNWLVGRHRKIIREQSAILRSASAILVGGEVETDPLVLVADVGGESQENSSIELGERLKSALDVFLKRTQENYEFRDRPWTSKRARPLLAIPIIGIAGGGLEGKTGDVLEMIIATLLEFGSELDDDKVGFDVVIVCRADSDYAALQSIRKRRLGTPDPLTKSLAEHARNKNLSVMFGAGASMPLGLPSWNHLIREIAAIFGAKENEIQALQRLNTIDAATILLELAAFPEQFHQEIQLLVSTEKCSLTHALIASIDPKVAITTNYDRGYEIAVEAATGIEPVVLPWDRNSGRNGSYLLKLHGDVERGQIVLSRDDFAAVHVLRRPLIGIMQEKLLTGHVLMIGSTVSDPTLIQSAEEVGALLSRMESDSTQPCGTVVLTENDLSRTMLLGRQFSIATAASLDPEIEIPGPDTKLEHILLAVRRVDILLDLISIESASSFPFALDEKYSGMLTDADKETVALLRSLSSKLHSTQQKSPESDLTVLVGEFLKSLGDSDKNNLPSNH
jgi:hypothetical protein